MACACGLCLDEHIKCENTGTESETTAADDDESDDDADNVDDDADAFTDADNDEDNEDDDRFLVAWYAFLVFLYLNKEI